MTGQNPASGEPLEVVQLRGPECACYFIPDTPNSLVVYGVDHERDWLLRLVLDRVHCLADDVGPGHERLTQTVRQGLSLVQGRLYPLVVQPHRARPDGSEGGGKRIVPQPFTGRAERPQRCSACLNRRFDAVVVEPHGTGPDAPKSGFEGVFPQPRPGPANSLESSDGIGSDGLDRVVVEPHGARADGSERRPQRFIPQPRADRAENLERGDRRQDRDHHDGGEEHFRGRSDEPEHGGKDRAPQPRRGSSDRAQPGHEPVDARLQVAVPEHGPAGLDPGPRGLHDAPEGVRLVVGDDEQRDERGDPDDDQTDRVRRHNGVEDSLRDGVPACDRGRREEHPAIDAEHPGYHAGGDRVRGQQHRQPADRHADGDEPRPVLLEPPDPGRERPAGLLDGGHKHTHRHTADSLDRRQDVGQQRVAEACRRRQRVLVRNVREPLQRLPLEHLERLQRGVVERLAHLLGGTPDRAELGGRRRGVHSEQRFAEVLALRSEERDRRGVPLHRVGDRPQLVERHVERGRRRCPALGELFRHGVGRQPEDLEPVGGRVRPVDRANREFLDRVGGDVAVAGPGFQRLRDQPDRRSAVKAGLTELRPVLVQRVEQIAGLVRAGLEPGRDQVERLLAVLG
ncbi:hypothetical protein P376_5520 [Streptomyces sp. HCCB10043]|nr:hypothetical protein P376_5520 [Streptomyces sp. HCCB10043]